MTQWHIPNPKQKIVQLKAEGFISSILGITGSFQEKKLQNVADEDFVRRV